MDRILSPDHPVTASDLERLHDRIVLIKSRADRRNPPTAIRGTIEVHPNPGAMPQVCLAIEFPQMFATRAHHRTIPLDYEQVMQLLQSENNGAFEFMIDEELEVH